MGNICNKTDQTIQYCINNLREENITLKEQIELQKIHIYNLEQKLKIIFKQLKHKNHIYEDI